MQTALNWWHGKSDVKKCNWYMIGLAFLIVGSGFTEAMPLAASLSAIPGLCMLGLELSGD
jgi:hypothetical protein